MISFKLVLYFGLLLLIVLLWLGWRSAAGVMLFDGKQTAVWQTFPFGILLLSARRRVRFANQAARRLLGADRDLEASVHYGRLTQKLATQQMMQFPLTFPNDVTLNVWAGPIGSSTLVVLRDMSEERQRELERQLYWGKVSHELRTPLTSILSHLEVSRSPNVSPEIQTHSLDIVQQQTQRLTKLIHGTLELGRLKMSQPFDKVKVDMVLVAEEAVAALILLAEEQKIGLDFVAAPYTPPVLGNPDKLKQVFINLIDNGMKFCEAGDSVTVSIDVNDEGVRCCVQDTGSGIPAEHLPKLTEQFFRVRRDVAGSGLGLAIVDEIVRQHNGRLHITSSTEPPKRGTAVSFTLPALAEPYG